MVRHIRSLIIDGEWDGPVIKALLYNQNLIDNDGYIRRDHVEAFAENNHLDEDDTLSLLGELLEYVQ